MNTTTAKITTPSGVKYIPEAVNYKGFLCTTFKKGVGEIIRYESWSNGVDDCGEEPIFEKYEDIYRCYFNSALVKESTWTNESLIEFIEKNGNMAVFDHSELYKFLLKWGQNPHGYIVEDNEEVKANEIKEKIRNEYGFSFELEKVTLFEDEEGKSKCYHYKLTHLETGNIFKFIDRNIFDFGRCINPVYPVDGGLPMNVEKFIECNPHSFDTDEKKEEYRKSHPTKTGWGWDRYFIDKVEKWVEMSELEIKANEIICNFGYAYKGIRL